jgi:hypothetical protein
LRMVEDDRATALAAAADPHHGRKLSGERLTNAKRRSSHCQCLATITAVYFTIFGGRSSSSAPP